MAAHLAHLGHQIVGFDRVEGDDLLDAASVRRAADGCAAVVHAGALAHDSAGSPEDIIAVNVLGTWHVLLAAQAADVGRVVYFSSGQVFGTAEGERLPDYFPVDDAHPRRAMRPYGLSKCLAEDLCAGFTARTGVPTVALRPAWVWDPGMYQRIEARWRDDPGSEWTPAWEYGQFVDVRDVAGAVLNVLSAMSWFAFEGANGYHIANAEWALTSGLRLELARQGTQVTGLHLGMADTDMSAALSGDKIAPLALADIALDGIVAGAAEILADDWSRSIKASLAEDPAVVYPRLAAALSGIAD